MTGSTNEQARGRAKTLSIPVFCAIALALACGPTEPAAAPQESTAALPPIEDSAPPARPDTRPVIVAFGDSLTYGQRVGRDQAYPALLEAELAARGRNYRVVNEGVSGDTTAVALSRVGAAIAHQPEWVVLALGANDGLRGLPVDEMESNLREIAALFRESGAKVILAGMMLPRNYGPEYVSEFEAVYPRLARELELPLIPFLLEGVAMVRELNNQDGIHPNAAGNAVVARLVADALDRFAPQ